MQSIVQHEDFVLAATDGFPLSARIWHMSSTTPKVAVLVNAGAGISSRYYDRFSEYLSANGAAVLVYDYRGIGKSRPRSLRGFQASVEEWGMKDCAAALQLLSNRYPGRPLVVIGHSVGGFVTGFAQNGHLIDRLLLVGAHTGYWRDYASNRRLQMFVLWHLVMPGITRIVGYFPGRVLRISEDIPAGAALEWANRRKPDFWWNLRVDSGELDTKRIDDLLGRFRAVHAPTTAIRLSDDPFGTPAATNRILSLYSNSAATQLVLGPSNADGHAIGHFGFFRSRFRSNLWPTALQHVIPSA